MSTAMDPEVTRLFGKAVLEAAHATEQHVLADSLNVEWNQGDAMARVTWQSAAMVPVEAVQGALAEAQRLAQDWRPLDEKPQA